MDLNKVMIIGNVVRDPELRSLTSGQAVANFSIATNLVWTDQSGQKQQKAEFHNIVAWRKLGEICAQYLRKGTKVYIEGRLETREWTGQDGAKRQKTDIVADNMIMLDRVGGSGGGQSGYGAPSNQFQAQAQNQSQGQNQFGNNNFSAPQNQYGGNNFGQSQQNFTSQFPQTPMPPMNSAPNGDAMSNANNSAPFINYDEPVANPLQSMSGGADEEEDVKIDEIPF